MKKYGFKVRIARKGETDDPRGFRVKWAAELKGNQIVGTFEQPFDKGTFILHKSYTK